MRNFLMSMAWWILVGPGFLLLLKLGVGKNSNSADAIPTGLFLVIFGFILSMIIYIALIVGYYCLVK